MLDQYDRVWHARKYHAEMVTDLLTRSHGEKQKQRVAEVAASVLKFMTDQPAIGDTNKKQRGILSRNASLEETGRQRFVDFPEFG